MTVIEINGAWFAIQVVAGPFATNEQGWAYVDRAEERAPKRKLHADPPSAFCSACQTYGEHQR